MENFLLVILTIPLADQSLVMNLYKVHNLPTLQPKLHVQLQYQLEGEYIAITKDKQYVALSTAQNIWICETTKRYLCPMNQALYKIEWCMYVLYKQDIERIGTYCTITTTFRHANMAQSLDGYLWVVSSLKEEKMRIRCLEDSHLEDIKPPLTIVQIGNGCEGYNSNLFIPAKSELTSEDKTLTRHVFLLEFNDEYQDLTKYSLIQQLNLPQLTSEELRDLPNWLTALQPMTLNHLKEQIKPIALKYPFSVHPNVVLIILIMSLLLIFASLGFIVWWIYKVRSRIRGFKPMAKLLLGDDLKNPKLNEETAQQILSLLWSPISTVTHNLTKPMATNTQPELVMRVPASLVTTKSLDQGTPLPPPPRELMPPTKRILPAKSTEHLTEVLKEVMLELKPTEAMMKKYKKYLQKQSTNNIDITTTGM